MTIEESIEYYKHLQRRNDDKLRKMMIEPLKHKYNKTFDELKRMINENRLLFKIPSWWINLINEVNEYDN